MKILIFTESYPTSAHPGRGIFIRRQAEALSRSHKVSICFPQPWLPYLNQRFLEPHASHIQANNDAIVQNSAIRVIRPNYVYVPRNREIRIWMLARLLQKELEANTYDIVHAHWISPAGAAAVRAGNAKGVPVVVTAHAGDVYRELNNPKLRKIARHTFDGANRVIAVALYFNDALARLGVPSEKIRFIPNGVDDAFMPPSNQSALRRKLDLPEQLPLFAYLGNLYPQKGPGTVLEAFSKLTRGDERLLIAGDGPMAAELRNRAQEIGVADRVIFRGWYPHEAMPDLLGAIDFFVLASEAEGNPVTVLESLCCGTPIIGSDIPAIRDVVAPARNGILVPPCDAESLAKAMAAALKQRWNSLEIARAAVERYSWAVVTRQINDCYVEIVGG